MLTIYRRHRRDCPHRKEGRQYRRCRCPIWVDGRLGGQRIRESLETNNWEQAERIVLEWQNEGQRPRTENLITLEQACQEFLADAEARKLREATIAKYRVLLRQLADFAAREGLRFLREFDLAWLRKFRASWTDSNISALKKLERLRAFFRFAQESGWIADNPALKLKNPIVTQPPTLPFTREEMMRILAACEQYPDNYGRTGQANAQRLRALVLLLRYSGLRIRDAVTLACDRIVNGRLFLYTAKTGVPVWCPLPDLWSARSRPARAPTPDIFSGAGGPNPRALWVTGNVACGNCFGWRESPTDAHIGSATRLLLNCCWPECRWSVFPYCLGTAASRSQSGTTHRGCEHGRSSSSAMCGRPGSVIRW
jgi:integrase/recombinase XerD